MALWQLQPSDGYIIVFCILLCVFILRIKPSKQLPPGPTKWPIIGNLLNVPKDYAWEVYAGWSKKYKSDILHLQVFNTSIVVLNSYKSAKEILDRRSANSRPKSVMLTDLSGFEFQFGMMSYGEPWKVRRSLFKKHFSISNAQIYQIPETKYIHRLLVSLAQRPADFMEHIPQMTGSVAISMTYGVDIRPNNDPNLQVARLANIAIVEALTTGSTSVDVFPFLKHLPSWLPGTSFHEKAKVSRQYAKNLREGTYSDGRNKMQANNGVEQDSLLSLSLEALNPETDFQDIEIVKDVAANVYMAASDTNSAAIITFILAMTSFPEIQKKAQEELDRVLCGRLPKHADIASLPYLCAIIKEVFRWRPIVPLGGVPHVVDEDISYNGYLIPAGSIILPNIWAMLYDEEEYPDPESFNPERYINVGKNGPRDPEDVIFGFGRRVCPGSHIGLSNLRLSAASILSLFDIKQAHDENGRPIPLSCPVKPSGAVIAPPPFPCSIVPRSEEASGLINSLALEQN